MSVPILKQFRQTWIHAIRIEFPNLSNAIRQKVRLGDSGDDDSDDSDDSSADDDASLLSLLKDDMSSAKLEWAKLWKVFGDPKDKLAYKLAKHFANTSDGEWKVIKRPRLS